MQRYFFLFLLLITVSVSAKEYDILVAADGSGDFVSIQKAISSVRDFRPEGRTVIFIKKGVYKEKIVLPTNKTEITLVGEDRDSTIITWDDHANIDKMGTFKSYTFLIQGNDIILKNLTIQNNAPQLGQAVSLHVEGDRICIFNCKILGNQDTIYLGREGARMFFSGCFIDGTTDFIFGPSTAWFDDCVINCKRDSYITAASTPVNIKYGFIFNKCRITVASSVKKMYLGRPWRRYAMTVFMYCELPVEILPEGWENWRNPENEKTVRYSEFMNYGPGSDISKRVAWSNQLGKKEAKSINIKNVFGDWNPIAFAFVNLK